MPEVGPNYIFLPARDKGDFIEETFRTITLGKGIEATVGKLKSDPNGGMVIQRYLFDKDKWTLTEAEKWVKDNKRSAGDITMEKRFSTEIEMRSIGVGPKIVGYAARFDSLSEDLGGYREKIAKGAFKSSLGKDLTLRWDHERRYILGRTKAGTLTIIEDGQGLYFECTPPNTQWARDLTESIRRQDIAGCSFGFNVNEKDIKWARDNDGIVRTLHNMDLREITITSDPAYPQTSIAIRSLPDGVEIDGNLYQLAANATNGELLKVVERAIPKPFDFDEEKYQSLKHRQEKITNVRN